ncbi:MAG: phosphoribosylanthranilate isomerase [Gammaproteobacteria bacterium]|nr:phosphoribosylanthranilate isomerase [Gammaproteobacteria bacterium]
MRTRIKICGIIQPEDALLAAELGVDAIGLNFYQPSPRYIGIEQAARLLRTLPAFVSTVGLFMNADGDEVKSVLDTVALDCLQFHGQESRDFCESFGRPYIKSIAMIDNADIHAYTAKYPTAAAFLLDAVQEGEAGGKGQTFDWETIPDNLPKPLILAGGLTPENVATAIRRTNCYAVDVSSGVETQKGIKSQSKIRQFVQQVNSVQ